MAQGGKQYGSSTSIDDERTTSLPPLPEVVELLIRSKREAISKTVDLSRLQSLNHFDVIHSIDGRIQRQALDKSQHRRINMLAFL
jgi:hypothetical protein